MLRRCVPLRFSPRPQTPAAMRMMMSTMTTTNSACCGIMKCTKAFGAFGVASSSAVVRAQRRHLSSTEMDNARRLADPNPAFPATGAAATEGEAKDVHANAAAAGVAIDPMVEWREYLDPNTHKPYYHNLKTQETSWTIPADFPTRFPQYYINLKVPVDAETRTVDAKALKSVMDDMVGAAGGVGGSQKKEGSIRKLIRKWGAGGFLLYLIIHNISLAGVFSLLYFVGFDLGALMRDYGFNVSSTNSSKSGLFGTFFIAVALNKMFVPLQMMLTVMLAPLFVPAIQPFATALATRLGFGAAASKSGGAAAAAAEPTTKI